MEKVNINVDSAKEIKEGLTSISLEDKFNAACQGMQSSKINISDENKLKFYGLYKVSTIGPFNPKDNKASFFDFTQKYKNQAWDKCSVLTKEDAMKEYVKLYKKLHNISEDTDYIANETDTSVSNVTDRTDRATIASSEVFSIGDKPTGSSNLEEFDFDIEIPENYENATIYSSTAKQAKKEIEDYLGTVTDSEKNFHYLKDKFYSGDPISAEYLANYATQKGIDYLSLTDSIGQSILHVAVDSMNHSAVESLIQLGVAQKLINKGDNYLMTPAHIASINFDLGIFSELVKLKPDETKRDAEGKTYLDYLRENDDLADDLIDSLKI